MFKLVCVTALVSGSMADTLWRPVDVDRSSVGDALSIVTSEATSLRLCGTMCDRISTCLSWNYENQVCSLTDLMVSPLHKAQTSDKVKFYTKLEKDFSVGSTVTASSVPWSTASAIKLANGIYNKIVSSTCFAGNDYGMNPWVLIEFQSTLVIHKIRINAQPYGRTDKNPNGAEVRVGSLVSETPGDFSSYKLFGKLPETVENGEIYTLENIDGKTGRSFQFRK